MLSLYILRSPFDPRDYTLNMTDYSDVVVPETLDYRRILYSARNQGMQGSCYAFAATAMKEWHEREDIQYAGYFSPQFIYDLRPNTYPGMYSRDVLKILKSFGVCEERYYPYDATRRYMTDEIYANARNHVIDSYIRLYTIEEIKISLVVHGPAMITFPMFSHSPRFWDRVGPSLGGHAVAIVGYTAEGFILRNSWGVTWNLPMQGHVIYPYADFGSHWEVWGAVDAPSIRLDTPYTSEAPPIYTPSRAFIPYISTLILIICHVL